MNSITRRYRQYQDKLEACRQSHLLRFWDELDKAEQGQLLDDLDQVDFDCCTPLIDKFVRNTPEFHIPANLKPPRTFPAQPGNELSDRYRTAREIGAAAVRAGKVAAFTVAGGQGTRLGYDGPKGGFELSPVRNACLFQIFAEGLLGTERLYGRRPSWYIMTSPANHAATQDIFAQNRFFGLADEDVIFFPQGQMPAFTPMATSRWPPNTVSRLARTAMGEVYARWRPAARWTTCARRVSNTSAISRSTIHSCA